MSIRQLLEASPLGFHLCGSRKLGTHDHGSDWDFVVTDCPEVHILLDQYGFSPMGQPGYEDDGTPTVCVMQIADADTFELLQVSVEVDSKYKLAIMEALRVCPRLRELDRGLRGSRDRDILWRTLYRLAGYVPPVTTKAAPTPTPMASAVDIEF